MDDGLNGSQLLSSLNDAVIFDNNNMTEVGRIVELHGHNRVSVEILSRELLTQYSLPCVTVVDYPCAVKSGMVELIEIAEVLNIHRSTITDLAFIVPLHEVESGLFHLSGANNTFYIRYQCDSSGEVDNYKYSPLLARVAQPLSYRIFRGLNLLSLSVKKVFFPSTRGANNKEDHPFISGI
jgi:hypothetical protein